MIHQCTKSNILLLGVSNLTALYLPSGAFPKITFVCEKITTFSLKSGYAQIHEATSRQIPLHIC